ncbi:T-box transcription factor TBX20 isoform X2 [Pocillopora verrucosa]|uniref:T-box transcription factor TBX20-like isoform X2 n=1 Tax=Pocillopora damicornis TaxID=46731 RepID=UPI000F5591EF|nr:T-box transcription factor TBX20-like isoform X2 [Pocillopora damicornis]XP_058971485.1 T-box transcription factor TBX20-like isoform X2 [Pocillopora verrucosa]
MRGSNKYTTLRLSREHSAGKMSLKHSSSQRAGNLSNNARAFSIASLVHEELETRPDEKSLLSEREKHYSPVPRKKLKTLKPNAILEGKELWNCFYRLGTEMIITKTGRRMFPTVRVSFVDLEPDAKYAVLLDIMPLDSKRHRYSYADSAWFVAGEADAAPPKVMCVHPDSPFTGQQLERQVLSFEKVKLTNNRDDKRGNIILNSMHKYQPRIHLVKDPASENVHKTDLTEAQTFVFPETTFMAVTSYQNHLITRLKIYSNPFAKGFRDSIRFLGNTERESYLMSNGIQAYENEDGTCFLSSGALTYDSRDLFSDEIYQVSAPAQWGSWEDLSCCHSSSVTLSNSCYPHSIQCASSSDVYNRAHAWWRYPISHPEDGVLIKY